MKFQQFGAWGGARQRIARDLMLSASVFVALSGVAHAQDAEPQSAPAAPSTADGNFENVQVEAQDIVVTGYRGSIEKSVQQKREANAFIDVITAEDIGKFPDKNVADALQRVPGVVITRDGGEGSRVSIRGLQSGLTQTLLNGNFLAGADSGQPQRSFNYVMLPANFIASTEVYKSSEARLEEGGVGGTIILNTRRPLDVEANSGFISVEGVYADTTKKFEPQIGAQYSWKNQDETLGLLVGGVWQKRSNRELRSNAGPWRWWSDRNAQGQVITPAVDVNGNPYENNDAISYWPGQGQTMQNGMHYSGYWAPQNVSAEVFDQDRERLGIQATAQVKPFDELTITANYFRFQYSSDFVANRVSIPEWGYGQFWNGVTFDKSNTIFQSASFALPAAGTGCLVQTPTNPRVCTMETPWLTGTYSREKQVSNTYEAEGKFESGHFAATLKIGETRAEGGPSTRFSVAIKPRLTTQSGADVNGSALSAWDISSGRVNFEFSPDVLDNLKKGIAGVDIGSTGSGFDNSEISQRYVQFDMTRSFDNSFLNSIQLGGKFRNLQIERETGRNEWYANAATLQRYQDTPQGSVARPEFFYDQPMDNLIGGFTTNIMPGINFERYYAYLNETYGDAVRVPEPNNLYRINEKVWAGYAQINFGSGGFRGNIGLRVAKTDQSGNTSDRLQYLDDYCVNGPGGSFDPNRPVGADGNCTVLPLSQRERIINVRVNEARDYTDWLPSFNASYELTPNLIVRAAAAKVVSRPALSDLGGARSLTYRSAAYAFDRNQFGEFEGWSGSGGNSQLNPFSAWQYDLGLEWYFQRGSVIGATLFRKDVSDFVVPLVLDVTREVAGQQVLIQPFSTVANGSNARSQGVEVYAQHTLPFGLGAQVNFTYNDTSVADVSLDGESVGSSPLVGSSKTQINGSIFYERGPILLRASYNRRGEVVGGLSSGLNVYTAPYEQVDLNASYEIRKGLLLSASIINLTKSEESQYLGNDTKARFTNINYFGRRAYVGLSFNF
ncbi:TonB-dependent receptor [Sphingomonas sp. HF-S4]|uniref:TonB-dependent receptor n=1 Tax=Sphingomonas agrestis TaxID=3080540 RepID=A0ABU3Y426_9SPHN|nr:TonB-dependent receptor [Sphingomonas sp. HF-S4]MDV3456136.1 TonB-dependent receptor [Sphingomonas sp. HF-S4]